MDTLETISLTVIIIFLVIIATILRLLFEGKQAIRETYEEEEILRKKSIRKVFNFIRFNPKKLFGDYTLENKNLILEVESYDDRTDYYCKSKKINNGKIQVLIFSQRKRPKIIPEQHYIYDAYKYNEVFDSICNVFNEYTTVERIKQVLDMEELPFKEKFVDV